MNLNERALCEAAKAVALKWFGGRPYEIDGMVLARLAIETYLKEVIKIPNNVP